MDTSNNKNWREFLPEKSRIKNVENIRMDFRKKALERARDVKARRSNPSKWPSESLVRNAVDFEAEAFYRAANQQDYTEAITISQMRLELKYGLVTPASEFVQSSNSQMIPDPVELPGHQRNRENQEIQENQDPDAHLNWRTLNSSAGVQISRASTPTSLGFEHGEDHLRQKLPLKRALQRFDAHMAAPDTDDQIVPAINIQMAGTTDVQVDPDVSSRSSGPVARARRTARVKRIFHKNA